MQNDQGLSVALAALAFVAADERALDRLMAETGIGAEALRARAAEPELLGAVLDFLFADETLFLAFCRQEGLTPNQVIQARATLPGGPGDWA